MSRVEREVPAGANRLLSTGLMGVANALGVAAFLYPFFLPERRAAGEAFSHASDAPVLFAALSVLTVAIAVAEVRGGRLDARQVALLGILSGLNATLRLPGGIAGANLMFFLPIVCGYVFGAGFGFLLGAASMGASGVITGGVGPWLPFQMWALGWLGAGAGALRPLLGRRRGGLVELAALAAYGWIAGMLFGALLNLWFWPFLSGASPQVSWEPGLGAAEALGRYWRFYVLTSLAWDSARAVGNVVLVAALARPVLRILERFHRRFAPVVLDPRREYRMAGVDDTPQQAAGTLTPEGVREALRVVVDPEIGLPIVDLGLVYDISVEDGAVKIVYTLTSMGCPVGPLIEHQVRGILEQIPGVTAVETEMVFDPPWSPDLMTEEAKAALGMF